MSLASNVFMEYGYAAMFFCILSSFWVAGKYLAVTLDHPGLWDGTDLGVGILSALLMFPSQMLILSYSETGSGPAIWMFAFRRAGIALYAMTLWYWYLSIGIEKETDFSVPESLRPIEERAWELHLGWMPGINGKP